MSDSPQCKQPPGKLRPQINFGKCEGKAACAALCPFDVFEIRRIADDDLARLNWLQRFRQKVHGYQVAYAVNADACQACGKCVTGCPENAITLVKASSAA